MLKNDFLKTYIAPFLKSHGFKKKGAVWNRKNNDIVEVIDFQSAKVPAKGESNFTVNIGVLHPDVWKIYWEKELPDFIAEVECFPRTRIGNFITPPRGDTWWTLSKHSNVEEIANEILSVIEHKCFPFMHSMADLQEVSKFGYSPPFHLFPAEKLALAIVQHELGENIKADNLLSEVESINSWRDRVHEIRKRLSLA